MFCINERDTVEWDFIIEWTKGESLRSSVQWHQAIACYHAVTNDYAQDDEILHQINMNILL